MIGLDTNVLVRHIAQDDPVQSPLAASGSRPLPEPHRACLTKPTARPKNNKLSDRSGLFDDHHP